MQVSFDELAGPVASKIHKGSLSGNDFVQRPKSKLYCPGVLPFSQPARFSFSAVVSSGGRPFLMPHIVPSAGTFHGFCGHLGPSRYMPTQGTRNPAYDQMQIAQNEFEFIL